MAGGLSSFDSIVRQLLLRCPAASLFLARSWIDNRFRQTWDYKLWSWQRKTTQLLFDSVVNVGKVAVTRGSTSVVGTGTNWHSLPNGQSIVAHQFRTGLNSPIYTIQSCPDDTHLVLTQPYGSGTNLSANYSIYNAYVTPPTDFQNWIAIYDSNYNWALNLSVTQEQLDAWDAQRANIGNVSYVVASRDYDDVFNSPPLPRFEPWPHQQAQYVLNALYVSRPPDLSDPGATLPRLIRGDVLLELAMADAARWPGAAKDAPNPMFNLPLAMQHEARGMAMLAELARTDDELFENDVTYMSLASMPMASVPWGDARFLQSHDF